MHKKTNIAICALELVGKFVLAEKLPIPFGRVLQSASQSVQNHVDVMFLLILQRLKSTKLSGTPN